MEQLTLEAFIQVSEPTKQCCRCREVKALTEFGKYSRSKDGMRGYCKRCHVKESQARYNKTKDLISERAKKYRAQNQELIKARKKKYYAENKDQILQKSREVYQLNKEKHQQWFKRYYAENKEALIEYQRQYRTKFPEIKAKRDKEYKQKNKEKMSIIYKNYQIKNNERLKVYRQEYYQNNRELLIKKYSDYLKTPAGKVHQAKMKAKRKKLGFNPINTHFTGSHYHHLRYDTNGDKDNDIGIFIPKEIHQSMYHNGQTGQWMEEMNKLAIEWYLSTCKSNSEELLKLGFNSVEEFVERYHPSIQEEK